MERVLVIITKKARQWELACFYNIPGGFFDKITPTTSFSHNSLTTYTRSLNHYIQTLNIYTASLTAYTASLSIYTYSLNHYSHS